MAELLKIQPQAPQGAPGVQRVPTMGGEFLGRGLGQLGETFNKIQEASDLSESRALTSEGQQVLAGTLKEGNLTYSNPDEFSTKTIEDLKTARDSIVNRASNSRVKSYVSGALNDEFIKHSYQVKFDAQAKKLDLARGNFDKFVQNTTDRIIGEPDQAKRFQLETEIIDGGRDMVRIGAIKYSDWIDQLQKIQKDVLRRTAGAMNSEDRLKALERGEFNRLGQDVVNKLSEQTRDQIYQDQTRANAITNHNRTLAKERWYTKLATNQLSDAEIEDAKNGNNPFITSETALHFEQLKNNPQFGEGAQQVQAIMMRYYSGKRTQGRLNTTRAELNSLAGQLSKSSPALGKALNELQSDESAIFHEGIASESLNVQRQNRFVDQLTTEYDAGVTNLKMFDSLLGNQSKMDKAKIETMIKKGDLDGAREFLKSKLQEQKTRHDNLPPDTKAGREVIGK